MFKLPLATYVTRMLLKAFVISWRVGASWPMGAFDTPADILCSINLSSTAGTLSSVALIVSRTICDMLAGVVKCGMYG